MKRIIIGALLLSLCILSACQNQADNHSENIEKENVLYVSAAISLMDVLEEVKPLFEAEENVEVVFNLGSSGKLAQQIENGAPADIFISANEEWMDTLEEEDSILSDSRIDFTRNKLVLITNENSKIEFKGINSIVENNDIEQIAVGNPETVPAGKYTYDALENIEVLSKLEDKFVIAKDVRQVLTYVETENVELGFVYKSDATSSEKVKIIEEIEEKYHDPIIYPAAVLASTKNKDKALAFTEFLESDQVQEILKQNGFGN